MERAPILPDTNYEYTVSQEIDITGMMKVLLTATISVARLVLVNYAKRTNELC